MSEQRPEPATPEEPSSADAQSEQREQPEQPEQPPVGWLPSGAAEIFGPGAGAEEAYGLLTVDVPAASWITALTAARDTLGCTYFDWLSAVDEPGTGFRVCAHVVSVPRPGTVRRLLLRTTVPHDAAALPTAVGVYAGAGWHERETHEMFGVDFTGHPHLVPLLLPDSFEGHPLRKDFVLAARVAKAWPGAKEPGEPAAGAAHGGPKRRQMLPPGVPDPNEWGPLKGQLPPAPARPARGARAAGAGAAGERPARRTRTASAGSASQQAAPATGTDTPAAPAERPARRMRSASAGSASQQAAAAQAAGAQAAGAGDAPDAPAPGAPAPGASAPRRSRSASQGSASQRAAGPGEHTPGGEQPGTEASKRSSDAPWHHARPAFDEAPKGEAPKGEAPKGEAPKDNAPEEAGPKAAPSEEAEPKDSTPRPAAPKQAPPQPDTPDPADPDPGTDPDTTTGGGSAP